METIYFEVFSIIVGVGFTVAVVSRESHRMPACLPLRSLPPATTAAPSSPQPMPLCVRACAVFYQSTEDRAGGESGVECNWFGHKLVLLLYTYVNVTRYSFPTSRETFLREKNAHVRMENKCIIVLWIPFHAIRPQTEIEKKPGHLRCPCDEAACAKASLDAARPFSPVNRTPWTLPRPERRTFVEDSNEVI